MCTFPTMQLYCDFSLIILLLFCLPTSITSISTSRERMRQRDKTTSRSSPPPPPPPPLPNPIFIKKRSSFRVKPRPSEAEINSIVNSAIQELKISPLHEPSSWCPIRDICGNMNFSTKSLYADSFLCCKMSSGVRYMQNAMILGQTIVVNYDNSTMTQGMLKTNDTRYDKHSCGYPGHEFMSTGRISLPPILSVFSSRHKVTTSLAVEVRNDGNFTQKCQKYIDGTLHINGRLTSHNNFHALNDNILPLLSLFILDAYLDPSFVYKPRYSLINMSSKRNELEVPHMRMMRDIVSGSYTLSQLNGTCFSRIVWGDGLKIIYNHVAVKLRRQTADLARLLAIKLYSPPNPFQAPEILSKTRAISATNASTLDIGDSDTKTMNEDASHFRGIFDPALQKYRPANIVIYTRGNYTFGRSISGEDRLVRALIAQGGTTNSIKAVICCNFETTPITLEEQLGYAVYADVVIGLHGAGLTNGIFSRQGVIVIELKTVYGYGLDLFAVVSDARQGIHCQISVVGYQKRDGGHRPIDRPLIDRIYQCIRDAMKKSSLDDALFSNATTDSNKPVVAFVDGFEQRVHRGDSLLGPASIPGYEDDFKRILGPSKKDFKSTCSNMVFAKYWRSTNANVLDYCKGC